MRVSHPPTKSHSGEDKMSTAERNRKLKKILSDHFGNGKVTVRGHRGTAYGWVSVNIDLVPDSIEHRRELESKVWELIEANDIKIGSYGTPGDMGCDYGWGRNIHI